MLMNLNADATVWELATVPSAINRPFACSNRPKRTNWSKRTKSPPPPPTRRSVRVSASLWNLKIGPLVSLKISDAVVALALATDVANASSHPQVN